MSYELRLCINNDVYLNVQQSAWWNTIYLNQGNTSKLEIIQVPVQNFSSEFPFHYQLLAASTLDQEQCRDKIGGVPQL